MQPLITIDHCDLFHDTEGYYWQCINHADLSELTGLYAYKISQFFKTKTEALGAFDNKEIVYQTEFTHDH